MDYAAIIFFTGLIVAIITWRYMDNKLNEETSKLSRDLEDARRRNTEAYAERQEEKRQRQKDIKALICYFLSASKKRKATEKAVQEIFDNLHYVGDISTVEDFLKYDFDYILKIDKYARKGMLDVYSNYELHGDRVFRIAANGEHILLSDEEAEKMSKCDYSFFFENP
ncbi:MAG: hypothetical protein IJX38_03855 [Clostridia bacterium]|nr:hypothetical protein [Clostridia bacterium]